MMLFVLIADCLASRLAQRIVMIDYTDPTEFRISYCHFIDLYCDVLEGDRRSGGAIKITSETHTVFYTYVNYFSNCRVKNAADGGAVHFLSNQGEVYMYRNCGHDCYAYYGSFVTVRAGIAEVNESTYLLCSRPNTDAHASTTSLNQGDIIFQNHNVSHNWVSDTGCGVGTHNLTRLRAMFCTFTDNEGSNVMNCNTGDSVQTFSYCNILRNKVSACLVRGYGLVREIHVENCVFAGNTGTGAGKLGEFGNGALTKIYFTDCSFDRSYTTTTKVVVRNVNGRPVGTHIIKHLQTHECKAEFPLDTNMFTEYVDTSVYHEPSILFSLFIGIVDASIW